MKLIRKIIKHKLQCEQRQLFRKLRSISEQKDGLLPDEDHNIWSEFRELHRRTVEEHWLRKSRKLNLSKPSTIAEKIEWLKLNDHQEKFIQFTDKLAVRNYVIEKTRNPKLVNLLYGVYDNVNSVNVQSISSQFVIKPNHSCADVLAFSTPAQFDTESKRFLDRRLKRIHGLQNYQWPYWHIKPVLLVEEYLKDQFSQLVDYKIYCFNGKPKFVKVIMDRRLQKKIKLFDLEWNPMPFVDLVCMKNYTSISDSKSFPCPKSWDEMLLTAQLLSQNTSFVRVDLYDIFGECRFGELTLYPASGAGDAVHFYPDQWNYKLGEWLKLPSANLNPRMAYAHGLGNFENLQRFLRQV